MKWLHRNTGFCCCCLCACCCYCFFFLPPALASTLRRNFVNLVIPLTYLSNAKASKYKRNERYINLKSIHIFYSLSVPPVPTTTTPQPTTPPSKFRSFHFEPPILIKKSFAFNIFTLVFKTRSLVQICCYALLNVNTSQNYFSYDFLLSPLNTFTRFGGLQTRRLAISGCCVSRLLDL